MVWKPAGGANVVGQTLFGTDNIQQNIPHKQSECEEYSTPYYYWQSHITLVWI